MTTNGAGLRTSFCAVVVLASACATLQSGGFTVDKEVTEWDFAKVRARAAFELNVMDGDATRASQIGVSGCEHRAIYIGANDRLYGINWVLNSVDGAAR